MSWHDGGSVVVPNGSAIVPDRVTGTDCQNSRGGIESVAGVRARDMIVTRGPITITLTKPLEDFREQGRVRADSRSQCIR